jgi:hypothetical protein
MCRYSTKVYKEHYVCFDCRKGFKQSPIEDSIISNGDLQKYQKAYLDSLQKRKKFQKENPEIVNYLQEKYLSRVCKCPNCGCEMKNVGFDLKTPKREKVEEWKILKSMYVLGKLFHSCGCDAYGLIPKDKKQYKQYLLESKSHFQQRISKRNQEESLTDLKEYLDYWNEKISLIDRELGKLQA